MIINAYKPLGKTPLEVVQRLKEVKPNLKHKKIGYAGRLDPMAQGVLILLIEPETKKRKLYQDLDKEYEFEILFGIETDSLDILGKIVQTKNHEKLNENSILNVLKRYSGIVKIKYPIYSSKTVEGKPLFWWARQKRINEITIPIKKVEIHNIKLLSVRETDKNVVQNDIVDHIDKVKGNFRQTEIIKCWDDFFNKTDKKKFTIAKFRVNCSSGTYVRSLAQMISKDLSTCGLAYNITRTKVGDYSINESVNFFV